MKISDLKPGDRINMDFIKENDGSLIAPMISLFRKL